MGNSRIGFKAALCAALLFAATLFGGCAGFDKFGGSREAVIAWATERGFTAVTLRSGRFDLLALRRAGRDSNAPSTIYLEGDGRAWPSPWQPPVDPTPDRPVALALADAQLLGAVVYLGRPCQYLDTAALTRCDMSYWTHRRFAPEVIDAYMEALDRLKVGAGDTPIRLVGYSGGGVIATLLAMRRNDVSQLITVAAPLSLDAWIRHHDISPLMGSLDPHVTNGTVQAAQAVHFVGERDKVVPAAVVERFVRDKGGRLVRLPDHDHDCCWARDWPKLLETLQ